MPVPPIIWRGSQALTETPTSPQWTFGEQVKCVRTFRAPYPVALASAPGKGALGVGVVAGLRVAESNVQKEKGNIGLLVINYETVPGVPLNDTPLPPMEEGLNRNRIDFDVRTHPQFASLTERILADINTLLNTAPSEDRYEQAFEDLATLPAPTKALAENLYDKMRRGIVTYWQFPPEFTRTTYHWTEPTGLSGGGYLETPIPQLIRIPAGFQWLREADALNHNGTFYVLVEKWVGGKNIETDLYQA